jgi:hypothetical protein
VGGAVGPVVVVVVVVVVGRGGGFFRGEMDRKNDIQKNFRRPGKYACQKPLWRNKACQTSGVRTDPFRSSNESNGLDSLEEINSTKPVSL